MKQQLVFFVLSLCLAPLSQAAYFVGVSGSHLNLDYKSVRTANVESPTSGYLELVGFNGGIRNQEKSAMGYELAFGLFGTNAINVKPKPDWGTTWFYRVSGKGLYTFSFGLFFLGGADVLVSFYQDGESHYLGVGALVGMGYRYNDSVTFSLSNVNSSILFAGDNYRTLRGQILDFTYAFP